MFKAAKSIWTFLSAFKQPTIDSKKIFVEQMQVSFAFNYIQKNRMENVEALHLGITNRLLF